MVFYFFLYINHQFLSCNISSAPSLAVCASQLLSNPFQDMFYIFFFNFFHTLFMLRHCCCHYIGIILEFYTSDMFSFLLNKVWYAWSTLRVVCMKLGIWQLSLGVFGSLFCHLITHYRILVILFMVEFLVILLFGMFALA